MPSGRRRARGWIVAGFAAFVFIAIAVLLAIGLSGAGNERAAVLDLVRAEARGDGAAVLAQLPACRAEPGCAAGVRGRTPALAAPGRVEILAYDPSVHVALTRHTGAGRVAWRIGNRLPTVQCVRVRREGPLGGGKVELLSISAPIGRQAGC